jgi:hypothetical protein
MYAQQLFHRARAAHRATARNLTSVVLFAAVAAIGLAGCADSPVGPPQPNSRLTASASGAGGAAAAGLGSAGAQPKRGVTVQWCNEYVCCVPANGHLVCVLIN